MGASQFLARLRQKSGILLRRLWNGKLWHYGLRWQSEARHRFQFTFCAAEPLDFSSTRGVAKAVSPLRSSKKLLLQVAAFE